MPVSTTNKALPLIVLQPLQHRNQSWIAISAPLLQNINNLLRQLPAIKFSKTNKCWLVPLSRENYKTVYHQLNAFARLDTTAMKKWFTENGTGNSNHIAAPPVVVTENKINNKPPVIKVPAKVLKNNTETLLPNTVNSALLKDMLQLLQLKGYSEKTQITYTGEMAQFLQHINKHSAESFTVQRLKDYLQYCYATLKLSENTIHSRINAMKFYYEQVLKRERFFWEIPRPKKADQLPKIFNQDEIAGIINSMPNIKHKVMLMIAYSAGLRVSEVVQLQTYQIDSKRMSILVERAKGKKDRFVTLSPVLLVMLRQYATLYKPAKQGYLFAGATPGSAYSSRSLQQVIQQAKKKAGIIKPGSIHALRHSFATHLLDKGTDISMIQKLLGHNDLKTTLRYLHTTNKDLLKIISPLDNLDLK